MNVCSLRHPGKVWFLSAVFLALVSSIAAATGSEEADAKTTTVPKTSPSEDQAGGFLERLKPMAWQKHPLVDFNAITEMTPEGRKRPVPSPERPIHYLAAPMRLGDTGYAVEATGKPPSTAELEAAMRKALATNGYLPVEDSNQRPDILLFFAFGSHATDPLILATGDEGQGARGADELVKFVVRDARLFRDIVERAQFVAGDKFASELKSAIDAEIRKMGREGMTAGELADCKLYLIGSIPRMLETNQAIATFLHTAEFFGLGLDHDLRLPALLDAVTLDEANAAARRTLDPSRAAVVVAGPYTK